ncbi:MAG: (d)CMP kinase [Thermodesulfovibrionales bacterium]
MGRVVAIDGPSGAGKSTVSRLLAERLGFKYLDTGALYRATALYLRRKGLNENSTDEEIKHALDGFSITFKEERVFIKGSGNKSSTIGHLSDEDVSEIIRTTEIGHYASVFSARKVVRDFLLHIQRDMARESDLVAEGRDMTTVVFPDAWKKFFITASEDERARRRFEQLKDKGIDITINEAIRDVRERDKRDQERDIAPLRASKDAIIIDTSNKKIEEVIEEMLSFIK